MKNKIRIIDLLVKTANREEVPKKIQYKNTEFIYHNDLKQYYDGKDTYEMNRLTYRLSDGNMLNDTVEILEEEDKDIPLIPDDELWEIDGKKGIIEDAHTYSEISRDNAINRNFKVLKEKINQVVEEFNEYRKENE